MSRHIEKVDPLTMLLYNIHCKLIPLEIKTLAAISNVTKREDILDGLDLFVHLVDKNRIEPNYLEMLLTSINRFDLVEQVRIFYSDRWECSSYCFTVEKWKLDGEIPLVRRSNFERVDVTTENFYDIFLHFHETDKKYAMDFRAQAETFGILFSDDTFDKTWNNEEESSCRYFIPLISKSYIDNGLDNILKTVLDKEITPNASLKRIIPILIGITPDYVKAAAPSLEPLSRFCYIAGKGEYVSRVTEVIRKCLKTVVNTNHIPPLLLTCCSRDAANQQQSFTVSLSANDSFTVARNDHSVLFRGDKGIKGLRNVNQQGHCKIESCNGNISLTGFGHPLTIVVVNKRGCPLPEGVSTLYLGKEWITIAGRRNIQKCMARIRVETLSNLSIFLKVISPKARDSVCFTSTMILGSGEGSHLKLIVPGVDIGKHHAIIRPTPQLGWEVVPVSESCHMFIQLAKDCTTTVTIPHQTTLLLGSNSSLTVTLKDQKHETQHLPYDT